MVRPGFLTRAGSGLRSWRVQPRVVTAFRPTWRIRAMVARYPLSRVPTDHNGHPRGAAAVLGLLNLPAPVRVLTTHGGGVVDLVSPRPRRPPGLPGRVGVLAACRVCRPQAAWRYS